MQYQFDKFVLDPDNFELRKNDQPVELRAKAFHVLSCLLKNRHRMVSKDELLDEVWHKQFIAESTLNSCIKTVRQVLGDDGKNQKYIQTVRGMGYRFVSPVEMIKPTSTQQTTISKRLGERSEKTFVGRKQETQTILDAFSQPVMPFWVCFIYGSGGIGKTSILKNLSRKIPEEEIFIYFDCRESEPTPDGFIQSLAKILLTSINTRPDDSKQYTLHDVTNILSNCGTRILLCIDQFESFLVNEAWMRQTFFPSLPDTVLSVIASRLPPKAAWYTNSDWANAFQIIELGDLSEKDSCDLLASRNIPQEQINQVRKFAKGYPLALELAAMLYRTQPGYQFSGNLTPIEVVTELATSVLTGLSDVEKEAVEALSTVLRANEPILCALLGLRDASKLFIKIRELPFVNYSAQGIALHDVVRDAIEKDLSYRDPARKNEYRQNALAYFEEEIEKIPYQRHWQLTADFLFLIETPIVREAYFPSGSSEYSIQQATPEDVEEIIRISKSAEPDEATAITELWLEKYLEHFYVAKTADGRVAAFDYFCTPDAVDLNFLKQDPVTAAWVKHLEDSPIEKGERVLFLRRWITPNIGDDMSPAQGAFWLDIKRAYMALRPQLRRLYTATTHRDVYLPVIKSVGFQLLPNYNANIGGVEYHTAMVDFGEKSFDGWLLKLVKRQFDGALATSSR